MRSTGPDFLTRQLVWNRDLGRCVLCGDPGQDIQHRRARGSGGTRRPNANSPANLVLLCRDCHRHVEAHPTEALDRGLRVPQSVERPETAPLVWHGRTVLLLEDGSVQDVQPDWSNP